MLWRRRARRLRHSLRSFERSALGCPAYQRKAPGGIQSAEDRMYLARHGVNRRRSAVRDFEARVAFDDPLRDGAFGPGQFRETVDCRPANAHDEASGSLVIE